MSTDRIEKRVLLRASRERVWQAVSDSAQFGSWFGMSFDGPFVAGIMLTISESGFENIPLQRRAAAFKANDGGWAMQTQLIAKYLAMQA